MGIDGEMDGVTVKNGTVTLPRGGREVVKIVKGARPRPSPGADGKYEISWGPVNMISWGPVAENGWQVGVLLEPQSEQYVVGQSVTPRFFYRNTAAEQRDISFPTLIPPRHYGEITAVDASGTAIPIEHGTGPSPPTGWVATRLGSWEHWGIRGLPIVIGDVVRGAAGAVIRAKPGQTVRMRFSLPNYADTDANVICCNNA